MGEPRIAKTVVLNTETYVFDVDGKPFPWWLPENARPTARKLADDCYAVDVVFFAIRRDDENSSCRFEQTEWGTPVICGIEFPWWIDEDGLKYTIRRTDVPTVELTFFAEHVDGLDVTSDTALREDGKVRDISGYVIARTA